MEKAPSLHHIFFPHATEKIEQLKGRNGRFVHYTSAEAAIKIIGGKEVWLRKSSTMNDFSEITHGLDCLVQAYDGDIGARFKSAVTSVFPDLIDKVEEIFRSKVPHYRHQTYMTCLSEHHDDEDQIGRLSMWRAYGNVALVLNNKVFLSDTDALGAFSSPVAYLRPDRFEEQFSAVVDNIENHRDQLAGAGKASVLAHIDNMMQFAVLCTKHPGFREEKEWRVFYSPTMDQSERIPKSIEVIGGVPQPVCKIALKDIPDEGLTNLEIPSLLDRIIVGPNRYPSEIAEAFIVKLIEAGVPDASKRVQISDIPLRQ